MGSEMCIRDRRELLLDEGAALANLARADERPDLRDGARGLADLVAAVLRLQLNPADAPLDRSLEPGIDLLGRQRGLVHIVARGNLGFLLRELAREAELVVGMSLGGLTALLLAVTAPALVRRLVLIDVTPFDLGIDVAGGMFQPIIQRNSTIPAAASRVFATAKAQQSSVQVTVRQGSGRMAQENEFLGEFVMSV